MAVTGCKDADACRKARLSAVNAWNEVKAQAGKVKLSGGPGYAELSESEKKTHFESWTAIEQGAHLTWESFAFESITWTAANNGRSRATTTFAGLKDRAKYSSFEGMLSTATKRFGEAEQACR